MKCEVTRVFRKRMTFPFLDCDKRTDASFRDRTQPMHHKERSMIGDLPVDMVEDFIVRDAFHLMEHGLMKNC